MSENLERTINKIVSHPLFLKLKTVVENNRWHNNQDVYSHSIATKDRALKEINGDFVTHSEAKKLYLEFMNGDIFGKKRKDMVVLIALLHDIGKVLSVKEEIVRSIMATNPDGTTSFPEHQYWGSRIVGSVLKDLDFPPELISYIAKVIKLHDTFNDAYLVSKSDWSMHQLINDVKAQAEGVYIEVLFNIYCDNYYIEFSKSAREIIVKIFNNPYLYSPREYIIQ